jgi:hypothetical protein
MEFKFKTRGVDQVAEELRGAVHQGLLDGLEALGARGSELVQHNVVTPFNLGGSIHGDLVTGNDVNKMIIAAHAPADTYVAAVETGTRPHFPPPSALIPWVKLKFHPATDKEAESIAFAIARRIAKKGTQGHFMFERALEQLSGEAQGIMEKNVAQAIIAAGYKTTGAN